MGDFKVKKDIHDKISEYLELYIELWSFSGSIVAINDGEILFKKAYK